MSLARTDQVLNPFGKKEVAQTGGASSNALITREAQAIAVQMMLARQFPRNQIEAADRALNAFSIPELCEEAKYAYARGGESITGLSIRAAEVLAQCWGNIRTGVAEMTNGDGQSEMLAYAQDLETGFSDEKRFFVKHVRETRQGNKPITSDRDIYELGANMGARRKRACILAVIPKSLQDAVERQIDVTLKNRAEVTPEVIKALLEKFAEKGVSKEQIEKRIQRRIEAMLPAQLIQMRRIYNSLKDAMSTPSDWFEAVGPSGGSSRADDVLGAMGATGTTVEGEAKPVETKPAEQQKTEPPKAEESKSQAQPEKKGGKKVEPLTAQQLADKAGELLRKAAAINGEALETTWKDVKKLYSDAGIELPLDVETVHHDLKASLAGKNNEMEL